jgi:hypothetical protein
VVKHEFAKAMKLRRHIARAGWWNQTPAVNSSARRSVSSRSTPRDLELRLLDRWFGARSPWEAVQRSQSLERLPSAIRAERRSRSVRCTP